MGRGVPEDGGHDLPHFGYVVQPLQAKPEGLGAWFTIAFSGQEVPDDGDHPD